MINCVINGEDIKDDWCGTIESGSVVLTDINTTAAAVGTAEKIAEVTAKLKNGEIKVFDTNNFTVKGEKLTSYLADVDDAGDFKGETEVVINGIFEESVKRSAPYFDIDIDGITILAAQ
jgi:basic membrane protein A